MATTGTIQRIFERHGWHYAVRDGAVGATFDGVLIAVFPESYGAYILTKVYDPAQSERRAFLAKARDLETFFDAVNREFTNGYFEYDPDQANMGVWYHLPVHFVDGPQDDQLLTHAIALAVSAVKAFGPIVREIAQGRLSLTQALDILSRALAAIDSNRRLRSA